MLQRICDFGSREQMFKQFGGMRDDMDKRFGDVDKRFGEMRDNMDKQFGGMRDDIYKWFGAADARIAAIDVRLNTKIDSNLKWMLGVQIAMWVTIIAAVLL